MNDPNAHFDLEGFSRLTGLSFQEIQELLASRKLVGKQSQHGTWMISQLEAAKYLEQRHGQR